MEKFHEVVSGLLLKKIYKIMKWKGTQKALIERIAYVFNSPLKLSSRDFKSLRKQYYIMVKNNKLDWASICNVYPEKDPHYIIETWQSFKGNKYVNDKKKACPAAQPSIVPAVPVFYF